MPGHANIRTLPSWLFDAHFSARDRPNFPDATYLTKKFKLPKLLICTRCHAQDNPVEMYTELTSSMSVRGNYTSLTTVKITWPGHQLEASRKQYVILRKRF